MHWPSQLPAIHQPAGAMTVLALGSLNQTD
jgi:hypothetical protein